MASTTSRWKTLPVVAICSVGLLVGGCSGSGDRDVSRPTVDPEDMAPGDFILSPQEVVQRSKDIAACLREHGVSVRVDQYGTISSTGRSDGEAEQECYEELGLDALPQPDAEQRAGIYDLLVAQQRCIEEQTGLDLATPPSKQTYVEGTPEFAPESAWEAAISTGGVPPGDLEAQRAALLEECPRP